MSTEICFLCEEESTPWFYIKGHICFDCYTNSKENKWISVKERLPDENIPVLVSDCEQYMIALFSKEKKIFVQAYTWDDGIHEIITHWMPLPDLPELDDKL